MITGLEHVAIAVPDLDRAIRRLRDDLGLACTGRADVASAQTQVAFFPGGETRVELIHPLHEQGPVRQFLDKFGGGLHHICFRTDDLDGDVERLRRKGYRFLTDTPQSGAHETRVIFIHPKSFDGVLVELCQSAAAES